MSKDAEAESNVLKSTKGAKIKRLTKAVKTPAYWDHAKFTLMQILDFEKVSNKMESSISRIHIFSFVKIEICVHFSSQPVILR